MTKFQNSKRLSSSQAKPIYDLEERTFQFSENLWIPACAGMTVFVTICNFIPLFVIPAQAGIQENR